MMNSDQTPARLRLDAAVNRLAATFRGMTARPEEYNCECHWGSAEELARLKVSDVDLDADLLRRTWQAPDWDDHAAILRRILPQLATALLNGVVEPLEVGRLGQSFRRSEWQQWPAEQATAVKEFLHAWWLRTLTEPRAVPAHQVLALIAEASATVSPWLHAWDTLAHRVADQHLAEAVAHWEYDLLGDQLPWNTWQDEADAEAMRVELTTWLVGRAAARLRVYGASEELLQRIRLLGLSGPARWDDPHWPNHRYS